MLAFCIIIYPLDEYILDIDVLLVTLTARFREDLGADSLDLAELIVAFGRAFEGRVNDQEVYSITTVGEAVTYIQQTLHTL